MPNGQKVHEGKGIPADIKCPSSKAYDRCLNHIKNNQVINIVKNKAWMEQII